MYPGSWIGNFSDQCRAAAHWDKSACRAMPAQAWKSGAPCRDVREKNAGLFLRPLYMNRDRLRLRQLPRRFFHRLPDNSSVTVQPQKNRDNRNRHDPRRPLPEGSPPFSPGRSHCLWRSCRLSNPYRILKRRLPWQRRKAYLHAPRHLRHMAPYRCCICRRMAGNANPR